MPELPSGLRLYISKLAVVDFQGRTDWFRCPSGHFWFMTPNLTVSAPPYSPSDEIVFDFLSAPVPTTREEAAQYVHIYLEDPVHGMFWRGDWLDNFEASLDLKEEDRTYWRSWLRDNQDFLDETVAACRKQAASNENMSGTYQQFPGEYMIHMTMPANSIGKEIVPSRVKPYALSQLMERKHKLPDSVKQLDYEVAVNYVAADLQDRGYRVRSANRDRTSSPSLIVQSRSGSMALRVVVARAPDEAHFSATDVAQLKACSPTDVTEFGFACIGLLPTAPRSEAGQQGFHMKYEGIKKV
ncbi:MAG TPA: hypothetical protein GXZ62_15005 [Lentisphaerae bacterium]|jgi:hypothetical protein|nr:hypothetical protein [Lentisphaerota bacterium]